ncbi:MAG: glycoside hydrolase family 10 protein [Gloeocapsa sp. DLM2.Bin57]|nr:MAG: glycoside hydrolase family 10 protein [Gloeocapsa sp. DLM2.Bin57]
MAHHFINKTFYSLCLSTFCLLPCPPRYILIITTMIITIIFSPGSYSQEKSELRGVWLTNIDSEVLFYPEQTANGINRLAQLNINTLYPAVWNSGYTLYPSKVAQNTIGKSIDPSLTLGDRDILQEVINHGHNQNMAVIPWFEFGFMAPAESELAKLHPHWLTQRLNGETIWLEGNIHPRVWLNPLHPEVQQFISDLVVEIVSKYDVDGIQFDDHFGYPVDFGYDDWTINLYKQEHNGKMPPQDYQDSEWIGWRAEKITQYMENLFKSIKIANPGAIVSVSPNPQGFSLNQYLLDWETWERKGLIEELVLQLYRNNLSDFNRELNQPEVIAARGHIPVSIGILTGLKGRPIPFTQIEEQIETVREQQFAGVSLFFYESLWNLSTEPPAERLKSFKKVFSAAVERPRL